MDGSRAVSTCPPAPHDNTHACESPWTGLERRGTAQYAFRARSRRAWGTTCRDHAIVGTLTGMSRSTLSESGLTYLHDVMASHVDRGLVPGLIALVAHGDDVHVEVIGNKAVGDTDMLERDAIFRIASLTKPVTAVAAMILVEQGSLQLQGSVEDLLPELADRRVLRSLDSELDDTVGAERPI